MTSVYGRLIQIGSLALLLVCLGAPGFRALQQDDYLTDAEIDQLRTEEGKEPPERLKLLNEFLKIRFERVKAVKTGIPYKEKEAQEKPAKGKSSGKKGGLNTGGAASAPVAPPPKKFRELLEDYLKCVDEISTNVEDFSTLRMSEPKPFLKSLKSLQESLSEQHKWIQTIQGQGEKSEKETVVNIEDALQNLLENVKASEDELNLQIEEMKNAKRGKSFR
jgi:hypothetical protein